MSRKSQERYRLAGLCIFCGSIPASNYSSCEECLQKHRENSKRRRDKRLKEKVCIVCGNKDTVTKRHCAVCREKHNAATRSTHQRLKNMVFTAYGGYKCNCCGEPEPAFLTIDHINNDGANHRREVGSAMYRWLMKNNYPSGFQVLCGNCQLGKKLCNGICPHTTRRDVA